jgi:hypothetical protein
MRTGVLALVLFGLASAVAMAGGRPDLVPFPDGYNSSFKNYVTRNRANGKPEIAKVDADETAQQSLSAGGHLGPGSVLVMEIYKAAMDAAGKPVKDENGDFKRGELSGIAVMQKRTDWPANYPAEERAGDWGFALYDAKGQPKANELACATCHQPFPNQDYVVTYLKLAAIGD